MQTQGRFSAIADISEAYVQISAEILRPAIRDMEELSKLQGPEWELALGRFNLELVNKTARIQDIARDTIEKANVNIHKSIEYVQLRAIEAAEDAAEDE